MLDRHFFMELHLKLMSFTLWLIQTRASMHILLNKIKTEVLSFNLYLVFNFANDFTFKNLYSFEVANGF